MEKSGEFFERELRENNVMGICHFVFSTDTVSIHQQNIHCYVLTLLMNEVIDTFPCNVHIIKILFDYHIRRTHIPCVCVCVVHDRFVECVVQPHQKALNYPQITYGMRETNW